MAAARYTWTRLVLLCACASGCGAPSPRSARPEPELTVPPTADVFGETLPGVRLVVEGEAIFIVNETSDALVWLPPVELEYTSEDDGAWVGLPERRRICAWDTPEMVSGTRVPARGRLRLWKRGLDLEGLMVSPPYRLRTEVRRVSPDDEPGAGAPELTVVYTLVRSLDTLSPWIDIRD